MSHSKLPKHQQTNLKKYTLAYPSFIFPFDMLFVCTHTQIFLFPVTNLMRPYHTPLPPQKRKEKKRWCILMAGHGFKVVVLIPKDWRGIKKECEETGNKDALPFRMKIGPEKRLLEVSAVTGALYRPNYLYFGIDIHYFKLLPVLVALTYTLFVK